VHVDIGGSSSSRAERGGSRSLSRLNLNLFVCFLVCLFTHQNCSPRDRHCGPTASERASSRPTGPALAPAPPAAPLPKPERHFHLRPPASSHSWPSGPAGNHRNHRRQNQTQTLPSTIPSHLKPLCMHLAGRPASQPASLTHLLPLRTASLALPLQDATQPAAYLASSAESAASPPARVRHPDGSNQAAIKRPLGRLAL